MQPLFQPPVFTSSPQPTCQWHWLIPRPATASVLTPPVYYVLVPPPSPVVLYQPPQTPPAAVPLSSETTAPPHHRAGLGLRVVFHGRNRPAQPRGRFWALVLDAAYAQAPSGTALQEDLTRWATQHRVLPTALGDGGDASPSTWSGQLYLVRAGAEIHVDHEAGCVVLPAEGVSRSAAFGRITATGLVGDVMEKARSHGGRAVLVVDVDAVAEEMSETVQEPTPAPAPEEQEEQTDG